MESQNTLNVLYMEDDEGLAKLTKKRLEREGYDIDITSNGEDGLTASEMRVYDALMVDYEMPGMNGVEVIRKLHIRKDPPPVVMVTGNGDEKVAVEAMKQGATDYIVKDVQMNYLELLPHVILKVIRKRQLMREREHMLEALQESEERYRRLIELSSDIIFIHCKGKIRYINPQGAFLFRATNPVHVTDRSLYGFFHQDTWPLLREKIDGFVQVGERLPWTEARLVLSDGTVLDMEMSAVSFRFQGELAVQVILRDISERRNMEMNRTRLHKLESIGVLAGGIAHDFNNLLAGILGNISLLRRDLQLDRERARRFDEAEKGIKRAKELTFNLLSFSSGGVLSRKDIPVRQVLESSTAHVVQGSDVRTVLSLSGDLWMVHADQVQLEQVFSNIIKNAVEAMPAGGALTISAENVVLRNEGSISLPSGKYVKITIQDEGKGISSEDIEKLFDPYFTTKQMGSEKGTGLGLAICYAIVRDHGGRIVTRSETGKGSSFSVYLPAVDPEEG